MFENKQTSIINLINSFIQCDKNKNYFYLQEINTKNSNIIILSNLFRGKYLIY